MDYQTVLSQRARSFEIISPHNRSILIPLASSFGVCSSNNGMTSHLNFGSFLPNWMNRRREVNEFSFVACEVGSARKVKWLAYFSLTLHGGVTPRQNVCACTHFGHFWFRAYVVHFHSVCFPTVRELNSHGWRSSPVRQGKFTLVCSRFSKKKT